MLNHASRANIYLAAESIWPLLLGNTEDDNDCCKKKR